MDEPKRREELARRLGGSDCAQQQDFLENPVIRVLAKGVGVDLAVLDRMNRDVRQGLGNLLQARSGSHHSAGMSRRRTFAPPTMTRPSQPIETHQIPTLSMPA
jgi:hypothetical protein